MSYTKRLKVSLSLMGLLAFCACTSKKEMLYFQDAQLYHETVALSTLGKIQRNDILSIDVAALVQESAMAYNMNTGTGGNNQMMGIEVLKLKGYLVNGDGEIKFPVLGNVRLEGLTLKEAELYLEDLLGDGGHLVAPKVTVRLLNAKVTVLGEVNNPGTFTFTEQFITMPQALGYAGDLTINGKRDEVLLIREVEGIRQIYYLDLTTADWLNDPIYSIRQNDIIVVNPNNAKVKSAGFVGNFGSVLTIASFILSTSILLTR